MRIGIPAASRQGERRVAATPEMVKEMVAAKHCVVVESGAGAASSVSVSATRRCAAVRSSKSPIPIGLQQRFPPPASGAFTDNTNSAPNAAALLAMLAPAAMHSAASSCASYDDKEY